jgi:hypothetical protein
LIKLDVTSVSNFKTFHFQELDWLIRFPSAGNEGRKYLYYTVEFTDRKKKKTSHMCLVEILDESSFENCFPHTVGYFKESNKENGDSGFAYLELRVVRSIEDFWKFLNDLDI